MIVVSVELKSAISRTRDKRLAQFAIINDGTSDGPRRNYKCVSYHGRSAAELDKGVIQRSGEVKNHPAEAEHVLNLVAKALKSMRYGDGPRK